MAHRLRKALFFTFFRKNDFLSRYGGHQFGHWASQLGDGRAHLLGDQITVSIVLDVDPDSGTTLEYSTSPERPISLCCWQLS